MQRLKPSSESPQTPVSATEWNALRDSLGDVALAELAGISQSSLRRYIRGERATPQSVAERLEWITMVLADLAGSYNMSGIRRWWERPRPQLDGKSPRQFLRANWTPRSPEALRIKKLSASLVGDQSA
jgi:hypothetical protein